MIRLSRLLLGRDSVAAVADRTDESFGKQVPELAYAAAMTWVFAHASPEEEPLFDYELASLIEAVGGDPDVAVWLIVRGMLPEDDPWAPVACPDPQQ